MSEFIEFFNTNKLELIEGLFAFLGLFSVVAKLTPTDADDKILAAILKVVHTFGLTKK